MIIVVRQISSPWITENKDSMAEYKATWYGVQECHKAKDDRKGKKNEA